MKKRFYEICIIGLLLLAYFKMSNENYKDQCLSSTCAITTVHLQSRGPGEVVELSTSGATGVVFDEDNEKYYVLTAGHVLSIPSPIIVLSFPNDKPVMVVGKIEFCMFTADLEEHDDIGIISFDKEKLDKSIQIKPVPLSLNKPNKIFTIGSSMGEYPSIINNEVIREDDENGVFYVGFSPKHGRSGSGVFDDQGIVGIITRIDGECVSSIKIDKVLKSCFNKVDIVDDTAIIRVWSYIYLVQCTMFPFKKDNDEF